MDKKKIISVIISGVIFGILMASFNYYNNEPFNINKSLALILIYIAIMLIIDVISKKLKKK